VYCNARVAGGRPGTAVRDEAERQSVRYALVIVPAKWQVYTDDGRALLAAIGKPDDERWALRGPNRRLTEVADTLGVPVLDLLPVFRRTAGQGGERLYFPVDIHWTAAGHNLAAQAVGEFLVKRELVK
jgi:hypothetical protein